MSKIPEDQVTQADLEAWYKADQELKALKSKEMLLRRRIFNGLFIDPKEGTNNHELGDGYVLKGKRTINREVEMSTFLAMREELPQHGITPGVIVRWKPELVVKEYRALTDEQRAFFERCLIIKDGAPGLEIVLPKKGNQPKTSMHPDGQENL